MPEIYHSERNIVLGGFGNENVSDEWWMMDREQWKERQKLTNVWTPNQPN
jgi:hypothetical protein